MFGRWMRGWAGPGSWRSVAILLASAAWGLLASCSDPVAPLTDCVCCNTAAQRLPRAQLDTLRLPLFLDNRPVLVMTPPGYDTAGARYPVVYAADAQEFFTREGGWYADRTIPYLIEDGQIPPVIVVAIAARSGLDRIAEYVPWSGYYQGTQIEGGGEAFLRALRDTLKPEIDSRYRTLADADNTHILGASIAGLMALYAVYEHDSTFAHGAAFSATLGWNRGSHLTSYFGVQAKPEVGHLYMDVGTVDDNSVGWLLILADICRDQGFVDGMDLMVRVQEGHNHAPGCWGERLPEALRFLLNGAVP